MKKVIMTFAMLALLASVANAEPYVAYLLTEGADPTLESGCIEGLAPYDEIAFRLWVTNDPIKKFGGFELGMDFSGHTMYLNSEAHPLTLWVEGTPTSAAFAGAFTECQTDEWVWIAKYNKPYEGEPYYIKMIPNANSGNYIYTTCETDYPEYPLTEGNWFGVNEPCVTDTYEESWGAVKSMYSE